MGSDPGIDAGCSDDGRRRVGRAVIDNDVFIVAEGLCTDRIDRGLQEPLGVIRRSDDADQGRTIANHVQGIQSPSTDGSPTIIEVPELAGAKSSESGLDKLSKNCFLLTVACT